MHKDSLYIGAICFFLGSLATVGIMLCLVLPMGTGGFAGSMMGGYRSVYGKGETMRWGANGVAANFENSSDANRLMVIKNQLDVTAQMAQKLSTSATNPDIRQVLVDEHDHLQEEVIYLGDWLLDLQSNSSTK